MKKYVAPEVDFIVFDGQLVTGNSVICFTHCPLKECESMYGTTCTGHGYDCNAKDCPYFTE